MNIQEYTKRVIAKGIDAAKADYIKPEDANRLEGSLAGFEACKEKTPDELSKILEKARLDANSAMFNQDIDRYWYLRCKEAEIEWVCNCISAILVNQGYNPIVPVTARAVLTADSILKEA